jgi:hypothetical protein
MTAMIGTAPLPAQVCSQLAWAGFEHIFTQTNFRLQIATRDPIRLTVEHDAVFGSCLSGSDAWEPSEQARGWIANRVLELAAQVDKTAVRRLCLQVPRPGDEPAIDAFLTGLQRRLKDDLRIEISRHFDVSLTQWEEEAMAFAYGDDNPHDRLRLFNYAGLDQLVSVDAGRRGLKWIFGRTHFYLTGTGPDLVLNADYKFDFARSHRSSIDETMRARSLVARAVQVIVDEGVRRAKANEVFAPVTRASIKADLERIFQKDGPLGLIHLVLATDRRRYHIASPPWQNARATALLDRQEPYLFEPFVG